MWTKFVREAITSPLFLSQLMLSRPYSRKLEAEADKIGLQLAAKVSSSQFCHC